MGFDPDPENMEETGDTYATYMKNGPDTVTITFYDADPETGEKLKEPLGEPIKIESGTAINAGDEAQKAFPGGADGDRAGGTFRRGGKHDSDQRRPVSEIGGRAPADGGRGHRRLLSGSGSRGRTQGRDQLRGNG